MAVPSDYMERVYAGVLGKLIGVYLGRPFEGWSYERIMAELGEINYYVHDRFDMPLVVTDDDIGGTFTFLRALPDYGNTPALTPAQIGQTWMNYIIEGRTILWWGGRGNSTEHTVYLNMKEGMTAPEAGSIATNGKLIAEQIGSQIFIDGWAMIAPGDPERAADFARRAASVSHDGEAIYGAQIVAAMEAQAFVEPRLDACIDAALPYIPRDSVIYRMIGDIREWHARVPDWRRGRELLDAHYGYDKYRGVCHMVPNHGLIILSLLYGADDFQKSLMIANTSGWDTDCNSGNVGCFLGIKNGLAAIEEGPDWRSPIADRLYLSTADGGRAISDAVIETVNMINIQRALAGDPPIRPKQGAHFHFEFPGSVQGFEPDPRPDSRGTLRLENVAGHSQAGTRSLALHYSGVTCGRCARAATPTFIPEEGINMPGSYDLIASPTLYPGQTVRARLSADATSSGPVTARPYIRVYGASDMLVLIPGPGVEIAPDAAFDLVWPLAETGGHPIAEVGIEILSDVRADGTLYLDYLTWDGAPQTTFGNPKDESTLWRRAWVNGVDAYNHRWPEAYRLVQNSGTGLLIQGTREWTDYRATASARAALAKTFGVAARVQGLRRYYALALGGALGKAYLLKALDGTQVLAELDFPWEVDRDYAFDLRVEGNRITGSIDGIALFQVEDTDRPLDGGGVAYLIEEGCILSEAFSVSPLA